MRVLILINFFGIIFKCNLPAHKSGKYFLNLNIQTFIIIY